MQLIHNQGLDDLADGPDHVRRLTDLDDGVNDVLVLILPGAPLLHQVNQLIENGLVVRIHVGANLGAGVLGGDEPAQIHKAMNGQPVPLVQVLLLVGNQCQLGGGVVDEGRQVVHVPLGHGGGEKLFQLFLDFAGAGVENVQKRLMLAVNIGHEVLRGLGQIQDGLEPDDLRARGLHRGILPGKQPQIVQLLVGKNTLVIHMILPFRHEASLPFVIVTPSGIRQGVQWSYDHGKMAGRWCHLCVINRQNLS